MQKVNLIQIFPVAHLHDFGLEIFHSGIGACLLYTSFIIAVGAFALLAKLLHSFPCLGVYDRLVVVLEYRLLLRGIFYACLLYTSRCV